MLREHYSFPGRKRNVSLLMLWINMQGTGSDWGSYWRCISHNTLPLACSHVLMVKSLQMTAAAPGGYNVHVGSWNASNDRVPCSAATARSPAGAGQNYFHLFSFPMITFHSRMCSPNQYLLSVCIHPISNGGVSVCRWHYPGNEM